MSIVFQDQPKLRKISVLGKLETSADIQALLTACSINTPCEINIFDANTLPVEVMEGLAAIISSGHKIKLYAYKEFLMHHLAHLGFPVTQTSTHTNRPMLHSVDALVIGGSAESLAPILHLIERLPVGNISIFIAQHILENQRNCLDDLLRMHTEYTVVMPTNAMPIRPGTIYIAPPAHHMKVANGLVYLTRDRKVQFARPSLDVLFQSIAIEYANKAVAVLLCGFGQDGIQGCAEIRRCGGLVLLEDAEECAAARVLPATAKSAAVYDYVLDLHGLTCFLASLIAGRTQTPNTTLIGLFLEAINTRYGYDFRSYQQGTIERRIDKLARLLGNKDFCEFQREVLTDPEVFERLLLEMSINVTSFFRHPEQFRLLREDILPYLDSFPLIKIWSAGCATGEEVYSLAFLLDELGMLDKTYLFATDMNQPVLKLAEAGIFARSCLEKSRINYQQAGGCQQFDNCMRNTNTQFVRILERLNRHIMFHHHSLVHGGVFNEFQLILCRNVLIYFTPQLQQNVIELFAGSLHRDGFLMLGPSESLTTAQGERFFHAHHNALRCYRMNSHYNWL